MARCSSSESRLASHRCLRARSTMVKRVISFPRGKVVQEIDHAGECPCVLLCGVVDNAGAGLQLPDVQKMSQVAMMPFAGPAASQPFFPAGPNYLRFCRRCAPGMIMPIVRA